MHLDDTPIKVITEILVFGKLLKEVVWSKPVRRFGRSLFKKTISVPRGMKKLLESTPFFKKPSHVLILKRGSGKMGYLAQATSIQYVTNHSLQKNSSELFFKVISR
ncbi:MAG TPA: hypothetical protein VFB79_16625 [Candidatus Angelobacter sp.]|nr:hypothetical protein [Candidatus Angelobacter sp.]